MTNQTANMLSHHRLVCSPAAQEVIGQGDVPGANRAIETAGCEQAAVMAESQRGPERGVSVQRGRWRYSRFAIISANDIVRPKRASNASTRARISSSEGIALAAAMATLLAAGGQR